jgi:cell fate regulator YaaT (PSP1 superfamily)
MARKMVGVRFHRGGRIYNFDPGELELALDQEVIVETDQGLAYGVVRRIEGASLLQDHPNPDFRLDLPWHPEEETKPAQATNGSGEDKEQGNNEAGEDEAEKEKSFGETEPSAVPAAEENPPPSLKKVLRLASEADRQQLAQNQALEKKALRYCRQRISELNMNMNLVAAEHHFDRSKIVIYFIAEERLDFRELVYDLASFLHIKVELRQIGVRHETRLLGGLGGCGRELCCAQVLREFTQVGVKMAKEQSLSLNPAKISGVCGRLMCCLSYEFETYRALCRDFPKIGKKVKISPELEGKVLRHSPLSGQLTVQLNDGRTVTCTLAELYALEPAPGNGRRMTPRPLIAPLPEEEAPAPPAQEESGEEGEKENKPKRRSRRSRGRRRSKTAPAASSAPESQP